MTTYIDIVNKVIKRTNEVQLDASNFATVIGVQAVVKDAVIDTLDKIYQKKYKWPFLATTKTEVMTIGDQEYPWPADLLSVDWHSFQLQKDDVLNVKSKYLEAIEREEWFRRYRDDDMDSGAVGLRQPDFVFSNHGNGFAVTPRPERAYTVKYNYFRNADRPVNHDDVLDIPQEYEYLLVQGALIHMYTFYDNNERSQLAETRFDAGLDDMVMTLIGNNFEHVYAGQVNY